MIKVCPIIARFLFLNAINWFFISSFFFSQLTFKHSLIDFSLRPNNKMKSYEGLPHLYYLETIQNIFVRLKLTWYDISGYQMVFKEELEDIQGVIRIRILKNRQHNGQKKKIQKDQQRSTKHVHVIYILG